jgi:hypothetical protein
MSGLEEVAVAGDRESVGDGSRDERSVGLSVGRGTCGIHQKAAKWLQMHPSTSLALPHPDERWTAHDLDVAVDGPTLRRLVEWGVINRVGRNSDNRFIYRTVRTAAAWIDRHCEIGDRFACGHRGLRNVPDGGFTCLEEGCDREFPERVAREVFVR